MRADRLFSLALDRRFRRQAWQPLACIAIIAGILTVIGGLINGTLAVINNEILREVPGIITAEPGAGFLAYGEIKPDQLETMKSWPEIKRVSRMARLQLPAILHAEYAGQAFYSDVIIEGGEGFIENDLFAGFNFDASQNEVPAILPRAIMDLVSHGISVHTNLPSLTPDMIKGHHFDLSVGRSSFMPSREVIKIRCAISGLSSYVGSGGPTVPLAFLENRNLPVKIYAAILELKTPELAPIVSEKLKNAGMHIRGDGILKKTGQIISIIKIAAFIFSAALLALAALFINAALSSMIMQDRQAIFLYRALGASKRDIFRMYIIKTTSLAIFGLIPGMVLGLMAGEAFNKAIFNIMPGFTDVIIFQPTLAIMLAITAGITASLILAALLPCRKACSVMSSGSAAQ
ncbi:MAG: ABC transporter permease [bacterium]|nr:ABC transporter permease [bacterium]